MNPILTRVTDTRLASPKIKPLRQKNHKVVGRADGVGGDVSCEGGKEEAEGSEEDSGAIGPVSDEVKRIPEHLVVDK